MPFLLNERHHLFIYLGRLPTFKPLKRLYYETKTYSVMEKKLKNRRFIESSAIEQINEATIVMRHFIELSSKLLPFFNDLAKRKRLSDIEHADKSKIIEVFQNYKFDTNTSVILMESDILEIIQDTYKEIEARKPGERSDADAYLRMFNKKHMELLMDWNQTEAN